MTGEELIKYSRNSVGSSSLSYGNPNSPHTFYAKEGFVYRTTGMDQVQDIIKCGYVKSKGYGARFERNGPVVYWFPGGGRISYNDPNGVILEAPANMVLDGQMGAISINDLSAVYVFENDKFVDHIDDIQNAYKQVHQNEHKEIIR